ncbi:MAG: beta-ketoacyl synthase N-terminal-like domain-containing protein [Myxococcota bacterium]
MFRPVAIVGQGCVLPGGCTPDEFGAQVMNGTDLIREATSDRWGVSDSSILCESHAPQPDRTWSKRGGYVQDFDRHFKSSAVSKRVPELSELDPLFQWVAFASESALKGVKNLQPKQTGVILGNLSYPSHQMSRFAEHQWLGTLLSDHCPPAEDRFMSGYPILKLREIFGFEGPSFALDSACASALYAIKYACDALHDGRARVMLAGAVNRADDLFIHVGFCALNAMSPTGQSRPFHSDANGLVPAEGCAIFALKLLEDARADGDEVLGIIRGVGLSNDGRAKGLLAPSSDGQQRAIRAAYAQANLSPDSVGYLECHATGTPVGDATELRSMAAVFTEPTPIGSLKSNLGHLITAAGGAALLKVLCQFKHRKIAPSLHMNSPNPVLAETAFEVVQSQRTWEDKRVAGISAFGFGGNNAHLIVTAPEVEPEVAVEQRPERSVSLVGMELIAGEAVGIEAVHRCVTKPESLQQRNIRSVDLDLMGLRFPPNDLKEALGQQLSIFRCAWGALQGIEQLTDSDRIGVFIGMGTDPDVCRYGMRWRSGDLSAEESELTKLQDSCRAPLQAAGVLGAMPNIPANRINAQWDFGGQSAAVSAEQGSGLAALQLAQRAIATGELDSAIVGAVDFSTNWVHQQAVKSILKDSSQGLDAAAVWVLQATDTLDAQSKSIAILGEAHSEGLKVTWPTVLGHAHAAVGLLDLSAGILQADEGTRIHTEVSTLGGHVFQASLVRSEAPLPRTVRPQRPISIVSHFPKPIVPGPREMPNQNRLPKPPQLMTVAALSRQSDAPRPLEQAAEAKQPAPVVHTVTHAASPAVAAAMQQLEHLHQQHSQFLVTQEHLHQQYLAHQHAMNQLLLSVRGQAPVQINQSHHNVILPQVVKPQPLPASVQAPKQHRESDASGPKPITRPTTKPEVQSKASSDTDLLSHTVAKSAPEPSGLQLDYEGLKIHASGRISEIFGPIFKPQDDHRIQTRMPEPPLLLAGRMTGLTAEAGSMKTGTIWTETDVNADSWWLHVGRMPAGIMIESGQADLMLISYLGIDLLSDGDRAYRLLGCELMYHDDLPEVGDTLCYDIHVDGHANQGPIRIFFFHYDCRINGQPRLTVRQGQAGFFTKEELANSAGILWTPESQDIDLDSPLDPPEGAVTGEYSVQDIRAFSEGRPWECFGSACLRTQTHTRTPRIQAGEMLFLNGPLTLDPTGGPWKRGYLRCEVDIQSKDWFFDGHFKNDPCMPGTLMFEGCLQAMAFVLTAYGYTNRRDGWRFQPMRKRAYPLRCRGQVTPKSKKLIYEVFIESVSSGPEPHLVADLLCTIDGLKAFHARGMGLELVPDYPISTLPELLRDPSQTHGDPIATDANGFPFDWEAMIKSALGRPSEAFGAMYKPFDGHRQVARLPGPPYHFMSRVTDIQGNLGTCEVGTKITLAYDIPPSAWYFSESAYPTMPFCVLLEAALQPCGWLASAVGSALTVDEDLSFRNLDGEGRLLAELGPEDGTLYTEVKITNISKSAGMIIEAFELRCYTKDKEVYELKTVFGFFPQVALDNQVGLPTSTEQRGALTQSSIEPIVFLDGDAYTCGSAALPKTMLRMIDRITGWDKTGGTAGLGFARAEKDVDPSEWFFKAHFFQDPVQPGSLGIEAMIQLVQWIMLENGTHRDMKKPRFECLATEMPMTWQYRGQVLPENKVIGTTVDVLDFIQEDKACVLVVNASLWVDKKRIYQASGLAMRLKDEG